MHEDYSNTIYSQVVIQKLGELAYHNNNILFNIGPVTAQTCISRRHRAMWQPRLVFLEDTEPCDSPDLFS